MIAARAKPPPKTPWNPEQSLYLQRVFIRKVYVALLGNHPKAMRESAGAFGRFRAGFGAPLDLPPPFEGLRHSSGAAGLAR